MKLVDLLELLTRHDPKLTAPEHADAISLLDHLRQINAFGNAVNSIDITHECEPRYHPPEKYNPSGPYGPTYTTAAYYDCRICGRNLPNV